MFFLLVSSTNRNFFRIRKSIFFPILQLQDDASSSKTEEKKEEGEDGDSVTYADLDKSALSAQRGTEGNLIYFILCRVEFE